jgi:allantoin racemase
MHIHLINPNSTASMTAQALDSALLVKHSSTKVSASNPADTPVSIEGGADEALAVPGMLAEIRKGEAQGVDAYVISRRFSIITTLPRSVPIIEDLVSDYGADRHCRKVRAINLPVLGLEEDPEEAERLLINEIEIAKREDRAEAIILGCAGMTSLCDRLRDVTGVPVIDGVAAAVKLAEALVGAGYATSKVNTYDYPRVKTGNTDAICGICA